MSFFAVFLTDNDSLKQLSPVTKNNKNQKIELNKKLHVTLFDILHVKN